LPIIVVTFILAGITFCGFVVLGPILFGLTYLIFGKNIIVTILHTEDGHCSNGIDVVFSGSINLAEKSVCRPAKAFGTILEKLQNLQDRLAKA